jgi:hypothetical protein
MLNANLSVGRQELSLSCGCRRLELGEQAESAELRWYAWCGLPVPSRSSSPSNRLEAAAEESRKNLIPVSLTFTVYLAEYFTTKETVS